MCAHYQFFINSPTLHSKKATLRWGKRRVNREEMVEGGSPHGLASRLNLC